jgi:hypothetical protein
MNSENGSLVSTMSKPDSIRFDALPLTNFSSGLGLVHSSIDQSLDTTKHHCTPFRINEARVAFIQSGSSTHSRVPLHIPDPLSMTRAAISSSSPAIVVQLLFPTCWLVVWVRQTPVCVDCELLDRSAAASQRPSPPKMPTAPAPAWLHGAILGPTSYRE